MALEFISTRDHRLMQRIHRWPAPLWVRLWMVGATRGGDGWLWCTLGIFILLFGGPERWQAVAAASTAAGIGSVISLMSRLIRECIRDDLEESWLKSRWSVKYQMLSNSPAEPSPMGLIRPTFLLRIRMNLIYPFRNFVRG